MDWSALPATLVLEIVLHTPIDLIMTTLKIRVVRLLTAPHLLMTFRLRVPILALQVVVGVR